MSKVKPSNLTTSLEQQSLFASQETSQVNSPDSFKSPSMKKQESQSEFAPNDDQIMHDDQSSLPTQSLSDVFNSPSHPSKTVKKKVTFNLDPVPSLNEESKELINEVNQYLNPVKSILKTVMSNDEFEKSPSIDQLCAKIDGLEIKSDSEVHVHNIHSSAKLNCELDLMSIAKNARNVKYNLKRFPGLIMERKNPKATVFVFSSGKVI